MIFGMIMLALVVAVAMYHYVQGFFSAMLSAVLSLFAAMVAFSFFEPLAEAALITYLPNYAHAVALVGLYAFCYVVLRLIVDRTVPGNVRFSLLADKIGAGVGGAMAGIFSAGVLAVAAQLLPLGPSIAGYSRFPVADREVINVQIPGSRAQDMMVYDELEVDHLEPAKSSSLFPLPVDAVVLGLVKQVSGTGSLGGGRAFGQRHPAYLDELFGQRVGMLPREQRVAWDGELRFNRAYIYDHSVRAADFLDDQIRGGSAIQPPMPETDDVFVVVRFSCQSSGSKNDIPFAMGNIRLVAGDSQSFPFGSIQNENRLLLTRPDDPLFVQAGRLVDFVFVVRRQNLQESETGELVFPEGSFLEMKRCARADLSGKAIQARAPLSRSAEVGIVEKQQRK